MDKEIERSTALGRDQQGQRRVRDDVLEDLIDLRRLSRQAPPTERSCRRRYLGDGFPRAYRRRRRVVALLPLRRPVPTGRGLHRPALRRIGIGSSGCPRLHTYRPPRLGQLRPPKTRPGGAPRRSTVSPVASTRPRPTIRRSVGPSSPSPSRERRSLRPFSAARGRLVSTAWPRRAGLRAQPTRPGGKLYVVGGVVAADALWAYDPATGEWQTNLARPSDRTGALSVVSPAARSTRSAAARRTST